MQRCCYAKGFESLKVLMQRQTEEEVKNFYPETLNNPEVTAYIIMSSGSTGFPKGVMHFYRNFIKHFASLIPYSIKGVILRYSPLHWITALLDFMQTIFNRGTRIIHSELDPEETCKVIEKSYIYAINKKVFDVYQLKSLNLIIAGGSKISKRVLEECRKSLPHVTVCQRIGASEIGRSMLCQTEKCKMIDSVGFVMSCTEVKIRDIETNKALESNILGELCAKSSMLMKGYYNNELATKEAIDDEGWYRTGDIAYYDENGEFFIVDRLKKIMKYRTHQVSPNEIEEILLSHPDVLEASVVPIPHEIDGDHAMAFVKKSPDSQVTEEELVKLSECLEEIKKLHGGMKFVDDIPKTPAGKIARQVLKEWTKALA